MFDIFLDSINNSPSNAFPTLPHRQDTSWHHPQSTQVSSSMNELPLISVSSGFKSYSPYEQLLQTAFIASTGQDFLHIKQ